jgi:cystathionine beta-lyase
LTIWNLTANLALMVKLPAPDRRFDGLDLDLLHRRQSEKWATHGGEVLPASVAEMDFPLAEPVADAIMDAVGRGDCGYAIPGDLPEAFSVFAADVFDWRVEPRRVSMVPDVMSGVYEVVRLVTQPGEAVVITPPVYPPFWTTIEDAGRPVVEVPLLDSPPGWEMDLERLERAFKHGATALLLCNPHNPTGKVFKRSELEAIAQVCRRHSAFVIVDEIHAPLTYPGARHQPYLGLPEPLADRAVALGGAAKAWNIAGLKCAVLVAGSDEVQAMLNRIPEEVRFRTGHLGVLATVAAFLHGRGWLRDLVSYLDGNRRHLAELLSSQLPGVRWRPPEATYLAWLDCHELGLGRDPAAAFLERGAVALNSGPSFGSGGEGFARLNFGTSRRMLDEVVARMARTVVGARS